MPKAVIQTMEAKNEPYIPWARIRRSIPGVVKIEKEILARPAQKGVPNPFQPGELKDHPAKPAYNKVRVRALKLLKDMVK